ncbi:alpha/beta fold hydrolase [Streptomyces sp. CB00316]|uniref:alpha/beta fold hydrolase n=1 Tax=Streptomyces sp. CB00316 TaxID=1703932 RepID=UPI00093B5DAD|nr:alpha/beta fold hydrolase [Streptomyces sp. CB00316]
MLRSFTTGNEVRDLDRLREALGERKVSIWGSSYGSHVGAVYAQLRPDRVAYGWLANMAPGAAERFPDFAAGAPGRAVQRCGFRPAGPAGGGSSGPAGPSGASAELAGPGHPRPERTKCR